MSLYIKLEKVDTREFNEVLEELDPLCDQIDHGKDAIRCFPVGGHLLSVVQFLSDRDLKFEIETIDDKDKR